MGIKCADFIFRDVLADVAVHFERTAAIVRSPECFYALLNAVRQEAYGSFSRCGGGYRLVATTASVRPARPGNALVIASLNGCSLDGCHAAVVDGQAAQWSEESADKSLIHRTPCTSSAQSGGRHYAQSGHSSQSWLQQRTYSSFE